MRRPTRPGSRAAPLIRAVRHVDRAGRGGSAESGARRARAAATPMAALGRLCVHRSDVLGALSRAEVDSQPRLRGLALEGVRGLDESRARTSLERTARPARNEQPRLGWRRGSGSVSRAVRPVQPRITAGPSTGPGLDLDRYAPVFVWAQPVKDRRPLGCVVRCFCEYGAVNGFC